MHLVQDVQRWPTGMCEHAPLIDGLTDSHSMNHAAFKALQKLTMDVYWLKSLEQLL